MTVEGDSELENLVQNGGYLHGVETLTSVIRVYNFNYLVVPVSATYWHRSLPWTTYIRREFCALVEYLSRTVNSGLSPLT